MSTIKLVGTTTAFKIQLQKLLALSKNRFARRVHFFIFPLFMVSAVMSVAIAAPKTVPAKIIWFGNGGYADSPQAAMIPPKDTPDFSQELSGCLYELKYTSWAETGCRDWPNDAVMCSWTRNVTMKNTRTSENGCTPSENTVPEFGSDIAKRMYFCPRNGYLDNSGKSCVVDEPARDNECGGRKKPTGTPTPVDSDDSKRDLSRPDDGLGDASTGKRRNGGCNVE